MSQMFLSRQGKTLGPYTLDQLRGFAASGKLQPSDLVWMEPLKKWVPASAVPGLSQPASPTAQAVTAQPPAARPPAQPVVRPTAQPIAAAVPTPVAQAITATPPAATNGVHVAPPTAPVATGRAEPAFLQKLRRLPKPILFGLFGAVGGLVGALFLGELLWLLLAPAAPKAEPVPPLQMAVADELKVYNGGKNHFTVKIARNADFKGAVELEVPDAPSGVTVTPVQLEPNQDSARVDVDVHPSIAPGTLKLHFVARATKGSASATGDLKLVVEPAPPPLSVSVPEEVEVYAGGKNQFQVKVARNGWEGDVQLEASRLPPGIRVTPRKLTDQQSEGMLEVAAGTGAVLGTREQIDILARPMPKRAGQKVEPAKVSFTVAVKAPPPYLSLGVPPLVQVYQGGKAQFRANVARFPLEKDVILHFTGLPAGITVPDVTVAAGQEDARVELSAGKNADVATAKLTVEGRIKDDGANGKQSQARFDLEIKATPPPKADVLFVLDLTGSMQFAINGIKTGIQKFVKDLQDKKIDVRVGMLGFRDMQDDHKTKNAFTLFIDGTIVNKDWQEFEELLKEMKANKTDIFTTDYKTFSDLVGQLKASGGGDIPESSPTALTHAVKQMFRDDASKAIVFITDAPPKFVHFGKPTESIPDVVQSLRQANMDQFHLVGRKPDLEKHYQPILDAFQDKGSFHDITKASTGDAFADLLPKISAEISRITTAKAPSTSKAIPSAPPPPPASELPSGTALPPQSAADLPQPVTRDISVKALQSAQGYTREQIPQLILAIAIWTAVVAAAISLLLIAGQHFYMRRAWMNLPDLGKGFSGGLAAGLVGGLIGQLVFQMSPGGTVWEVLARIVGWGLLGGLIGVGMALIVPNLKWHRGLEGGVAGGIFGALAFMVITLLMGEVTGRLLGSVIIGFCIGVMIALAEMVFRRFWLEIVSSSREVRTVTLGAVPIGIGGDERLASVYVQGAAPLALRYRVDGERVLCQDVVTGQVCELAPGQSRQVGNVSITLCSPASARTTGLMLLLSNGRRLALGEGMPLTAEDLPGLQAQAADGTVALVSRRPNDPTKMLLRNRSQQTWVAHDANGVQSTVAPGRAIELSVNLALNLGQLQGRILPAEQR